MRIVTSLTFILAASFSSAQAQDDVGAPLHGISTSHLQQAAPGRPVYRSRGYSRRYARSLGRGYSRMQARLQTPRAHQHSHRGASASRGCLTGQTRQLLSGLESRFGQVKVISTCRPGAVIAGSGRPSQHRYGKAVDFVPRSGQRAAMLAWLRANAGGAVLTYVSGHIHFDTGGYRNTPSVGRRDAPTATLATACVRHIRRDGPGRATSSGRLTHACACPGIDAATRSPLSGSTMS